MRDESAEHGADLTPQTPGLYIQHLVGGLPGEQQRRLLGIALEEVKEAMKEVEATGQALARKPADHDPGCRLAAETHRAESTTASYESALERIAQLEEANRHLQAQIAERRRVEDEIVTRSRDLERRLEKRTAQCQDLMRTHDAISRFLGELCSNPLRTLDSQTRLLAERWGHSLPPDGRRQIDSVVTRTRTLNELLDSVATYARVAKQPLELTAVDVNALVADVFAELEHEREGRCVEVHIGDLAGCQGDPKLLRLVFYHLLSNALKFTRTREAAVIEISCRRERGETVWSVADNGIGFRREQIHRLFVPFQRLHRTQGYDGAGVGLATVSRIVARHNGRVWASLPPRGPGAVFHLALPDQR